MELKAEGQHCFASFPNGFGKSSIKEHIAESHDPIGSIGLVEQI